MLPDFETLVGQRAFEQARGVVMYLCACNAEQAYGRMIDIVGSTRGPPLGVVAALLTSSGRADLHQLSEPGPN